MAIRARNDFVAVMTHEVWTPMHAIIALSSLLLESELTPEQCLMVETVLKSSNLLATLINDVLDLSKLEDGSLELESATFNLHSVFREAVNLIKPIAAIKHLLVLVALAPDMPLCAIGDEKRLLQTILNIAANAVKCTKEGHISITASVAKPDSLRDRRAPEFYPSASDGPSTCMSRFINLMVGHIWLESKGVRKGCTATFIVKLGVCKNSSASLQQIMPVSRSKNGSADTSGARALFKDENGMVPSRLGYQRNV